MLHTIKWDDVVPIFGIFMVSYLTATTQPLDTQNFLHCALTFMITKTFDF